MKLEIEIPDNATRKEVHLMMFGIDPPELDSPYYACARSNGGCNACKHKDDTNCDYNWWHAPFPEPFVMRLSKETQ